MTTGEPPPYRVRVAELPADERPRERLLRLGPQALTLSVTTPRTRIMRLMWRGLGVMPLML